MDGERWLVTGASGQLGGYLLRALQGDPAVAQVDAISGQRLALDGPARARGVDLGDLNALREVVADVRPTHIVHAGAMTAVSACHEQPEHAGRVNVEATRLLAGMSRELRARLVFTSTDMVFDGEHAPYDEGSEPAPLSVYGRTKAAAERAVAEFENVVIARVPLMYGFPLTDRPSTFRSQLAALRSGDSLRLFTDEFRTPVWLGDAARALVSLGRSEFVGLIHVPGPARLSRYELVERCAAVAGIEFAGAEAISRNDVPAAEPRAADLSLASRLFSDYFPELQCRPIEPAMLNGEAYVTGKGSV